MQIINPSKPPEWMYRLPIFNQSLLIGELSRRIVVATLRMTSSRGR